MRSPRQGQPVNLRLTLAGLVTAALAFALMQTFLIPALPRLQEQLHTSNTWVTWTVTSYLLVGTVATPLIGKLGDQHGKVRMMLVSLLVFLLGSLGAALAWNVGSLIAFRAIQGVGGAVFPLSFAIIRDHFPPHQMSVAMGLVSAVLGVGGGVGIVVSGLVIDHTSWRWLFVLSAAIVALALVLVWRFVPESDVRAPSHLDIPGATLLSGGLVALLVGLTEGQHLGWGSPAIVGLFAASAISFVVWTAVELRTAQPMVDMRMMARRAVLFCNLTALLSGFALYLTWVILPAFFQLPRSLPSVWAHLADYGFGTTVTGAGLWILPTSAAILVSGPVAGLIGRRFGSRGPLAAGMLLMGMGAAGIAEWHRTPAQVSLAFAVCGVGVGFAFAAMPRLVVDAVSVAETGVATGMNTVIRTVGGVVGAQVGAVLLAVHHVPGTFVPTERGFAIAFWVSAIGGLAGAVAAFFVGSRRAHAVPVAVPSPS